MVDAMDSILHFLSSPWASGLILLSIIVLIALFAGHYTKLGHIFKRVMDTRPYWLLHIQRGYSDTYEAILNLGEGRISLAQFKDQMAGTAPIQEKCPKQFTILSDYALGKISYSEFQSKIDYLAKDDKDLVASIRNNYPHLLLYLKDLYHKRITFQEFQEKIDPEGVKPKLLVASIQKDFPYLIPLLEELAFKNIQVGDFKNKVVAKVEAHTKGPRS